MATVLPSLNSYVSAAGSARPSTMVPSLVNKLAHLPLLLDRANLLRRASILHSGATARFYMSDSSKPQTTHRLRRD